MDKIEIKLEPVDNSRLLNLCGPLNNNIKDIEMINSCNKLKQTKSAKNVSNFLSFKKFSFITF